MKALKEVLENRGENYILPFFWQHGETESKLREYMGAIHACGIGAVCCECRPHPDFCGPQWWHDMDIILDEAKKRDMKVWILDDARFPTGRANGKVEEAPDELCKQFLDFHEVEIAGPVPGITLNVAEMARYQKAPALGDRIFDDDALVCVAAAKGLEKGIDGRTILDLTDHVKDGQLIWDVPSGYWRVMVIYKTRNGGGNRHYINLVSKDSCRLQIEAVYEPHWEHYKEEFGKTIMGFFSDEIQLGNHEEAFEPDNWIGKRMMLSWSDEVEEALKIRLGNRYNQLLMTLWYPDRSGDLSAYTRYHYMDVVTRAVEEDFSIMVGDWCREHGVSYIGHTIEDCNEHARMGQSVAHHFRGLAGQHMAGIDDICNQVLIGGQSLVRNDGHRKAYGEPVNDGEFHHFMLGKLGASHAALDPRKNGNCMCEIFGAYGWNEGTRLMKYLVDHFLVRGVNYYVPHAFSPKEFPDYDCPPHFYAHGLNPLYKGFGELMRYTNRVCHLISGGRHIAPVAVLYHAEAEWISREEGYLLTQKPLRVLMEHQIDCDIVWLDVLCQRQRYQTQLGKTLLIGQQEYRALLIPYSHYITAELEAFLKEACEKGFPVYFVGGSPYAVCGKPGKGLDPAIVQIPELALMELADVMSEFAELRIYENGSGIGTFSELRYYHYQMDGDIYLFSNESPDEIFDGIIILPDARKTVLYDAMKNKVFRTKQEGRKLHLRLEPYQMVIVATTQAGEMDEWTNENLEEVCTLNNEWTVSFKDALCQEDGFTHKTKFGKLTDMAKLRPDFSGWIRYETVFEWTACEESMPAEGGKVMLEFENAYETVEVWVNDKAAGMAICPPYRFDVTELLSSGENRIRVEVATTLERAVNRISDPADLKRLMFFNTIGYPYGLLGKVSVKIQK